MSGTDRDAARGRTLLLLAVGALLLALTAGYVLMLREFKVSESPGEQRFGAVGGGEPAAEVYLEPISIDAANDAMQVRAYLSPAESRDAADRDLTLLVTHDKTVEEVRLATAGHLAASTFEVDLNDGDVTRYPLDAYWARYRIQLLDQKTSTKLPVRVTVWNGVLGYKLQTTSETTPEAHDVELRTAVTRSGAFAMFALCAYAAMAVMACCALTIGALTFTGVRRPEATLIGALAAIIFALPVFRNALPGAPPLGVEADLWVFFWTELAAVLALALLVFRWAKAGPQP